MLSLRGWWGRWRRREPRPHPGVSVDEGYRLWASTYGSPPNAFQVLTDDALRRVLPPLQGATVLDVGCGTGRSTRVARDLGAARVVGVDSSHAMLAVAARAASAATPWVAASAPRLPFHGRPFDVVLCALVLGHVPDLVAPLTEMARVLRPGGTLVISDFHPCATLRGWERTVRDPATGREFAIEQHAHLLSAYVTQLRALGLALEALDEPCYEGFPVAFALRARASSGQGR